MSSTGNFVFNSNGPLYIASTDSQITETLESELYKTARLSPSSLRYFGLDLMNGKYIVELHFAEIAMEDDTSSWKGLGRRIFDVYIQVTKACFSCTLSCLLCLFSHPLPHDLLAFDCLRVRESSKTSTSRRKQGDQREH